MPDSPVPPEPTSRFVFATCQAGAEAALKRELARTAPSLRLAYSRPGLVTFKSEVPVGGEVGVPSVFARSWGASLGRATSADEVLALARSLPRPWRLHVWERAAWRPDEAPPQVSLGAAAARARAAVVALSAESDGRIASSAEPDGEGADAAASGDAVLDVVVAPDGGGEPGEAWLVGWHRHAPGRSPHPGGVWPVEVPPEAPSRAYRKLEEALAWSGAPVSAGQVAVEIGSSPGGASLALARRGVTVWGVDPGAMDPGVLAYRHPGGARVHHLATTLAALRREALPARVDWLLMDVNLAPQVALHGVARLVPLLRPHLRGLLFTLKLNEWRFADQLPALLDRVRALGTTGVRAVQLPANRQEICVWAAVAPIVVSPGGVLR